MNNENKYMSIIEKAIGQLTDGVTLTECIAEVCEKEKVDIEEMAQWIKQFKSLLTTIEANATKYRILRKGSIFDTISISDYF
jgi:hypothetical protein